MTVDITHQEHEPVFKGDGQLENGIKLVDIGLEDVGKHHREYLGAVLVVVVVGLKSMHLAAGGLQHEGGIDHV